VSSGCLKLNGFLEDIREEIEEALKEILGVFAFIEALLLLGNIPLLDDLTTKFQSSQISSTEYIITVIIWFILLPSIPSIPIGLVIHWIREKVSD